MKSIALLSLLFTISFHPFSPASADAFNLAEDEKNLSPEFGPSDDVIADSEYNDLLGPVTSSANVNCEEGKAGPLGKSVKSTICNLPAALDPIKLGLLNSTWKDSSLTNGVMPQGLRSHVDWRYKFGNRPSQRIQDKDYWMGYAFNPRQCGGTCPSAAFLHFTEFMRVAQTVNLHEHVSWSYAYGHRNGSNIYDIFRTQGMPEWKSDDSLPLADCTYSLSNCNKNDAYGGYQRQIGSVCAPSGDNWWNVMAMKGLNGVAAIPNANIYRGTFPYSNFFSSLALTAAPGGGLNTKPWKPASRFAGYSENALLMFLIDRYGPVQFRYIWYPNPASYYQRFQSFYKNGGKYGDAELKYGADMLIGKELTGRPGLTNFLEKGNGGANINSRGAGLHSMTIVGYRYIPESPESSYWIILNSHGASETKEYGFEYHHMTIGTSTSQFVDFLIPSFYWNKSGLPMRSAFPSTPSECTAASCEYDVSAKLCKCNSSN